MKLPVLAEEVKANVHGVRVISCSPGTVLLSCGLDNVDTTGHWDVDRYSHIIMVALCNRADHYIFALLFLSSIFFYSSPIPSGRRLDVYHTSTQLMWP